MRRSIGIAFGALGVTFLVARTLRNRHASSPEDVVGRYFEAWENGDVEAFDRLVTQDYEGHIHALAGVEDRDRATLREQLEAQDETFPERSFEVEDTVANGDKVAARVLMRAHHGDEDKDAEMEGLVLFRLDDGRIAEEWASWDYLGLAQQLGAEISVELNGST
jgi:ketosteroid isomerase-like protein